MSITSPSKRFRLERDPPRAREGLRIAWTMAFSVLLAYWTFFQIAFLYGWDNRFSPTLLTTSGTLRSIRPLWLTCMFASVAVGLALYLARTARWHDRPSPVRLGIQRLNTAQAYMTLCITMAGYGLLYRILPFAPMVMGQEDQASRLLIDFAYSNFVPGLERSILDGMMLVSVLLLAFVLARAWALLPSPGVHRRNFYILAGVLSLVGLLVPSTALESVMTGQSPVATMLREDPAARGLILGDPDQMQSAEVQLARYFTTHDDEGNVVPRYLVERDRLTPAWIQDFSAENACQLCRIPSSALWTLSGLPLVFDRSLTTADSAPTIVVEIPRRGTHARVYPPDNEADILVVDLRDTAASVGPSVWVVLKADALLSMSTIKDLLNDLSAAGVRRVDLAVMPQAFRDAPEVLPEFGLQANGTEVLFEPVRDDFVVARYVPPTSVRPPGCEAYPETWYRRAWARYKPQQEVPRRPEIRVGSEDSYEEFVAKLTAAFLEAPERIVLTVE